MGPESIVLFYFLGVIVFAIVPALISHANDFHEFGEWLLLAFFWPAILMIATLFGIFAGIPYVIFMSVKYTIDPTYRVAIDEWFTSNWERVKLKLVK